MNKLKKLHIIGICGKGTSAVALLMRDLGWEISGSDSGSYEPISGYLKEQNISFYDSYDPKNIPQDTSLILLGSSATLNIKENNEVKKAFSMGIPVKSFAEILEDITQNKETIVVCGSYGKSTCTSLLVHYFKELHIDPGYFIGAVPLNLKTSSANGNSKYFILEGDEYPHKNDDMKSKFEFYHPQTLLLTSAEHDHINKFPTIEKYLEPYRRIIKNLQPSDLLVCAVHHPHVKGLAKEASARIVTYGFDNADYTARNITLGKTSTFDVYHHDLKLGTLSTELLGKHNIENILGAVALCLEKKLGSFKELSLATQLFKGLKRRLDLKTKTSLVPVYEGFGSSYTKAKTAIVAVQEHFPDKEIFVIFEPHTFGWRNRGNKKWYQDIFDGTKKVLILPPPQHGKESHNQLNHEEILKSIPLIKNREVRKVDSGKEAFEIFKKEANLNSVILLLSSGDLDGLGKEIPEYCDIFFKK